MKMFTIFLFVLIAMTIKTIAQTTIPNFGFENWSTYNGFIEVPDNWHVETITFSGPDSNGTHIYDVVSSASQNSDSYAGNYAVALSNKLSFIGYFGDTLSLSGKMFTLPPDSSLQNLKPAFPVSARHTTLNGYYKFTPVNGDSCQFIVVLYKYGYVNPNPQYGNIVGIGSLCKSASSSYTPFTVTINYFDSTTIPDSASIALSAYKQMDFITMNSGSPLGNSVLYVDNLNFDTHLTSVPPSSSELPSKFNLTQNYPNPFNPSTVINYQIPVEGNVTLKVYDVLGNEIATLVNEQKTEGSYEIQFDARKFTSGVYFYQLQAGSFTETKKLILMK
jgi:hypothetical protein